MADRERDLDSLVRAMVEAILEGAVQDQGALGRLLARLRVGGFVDDIERLTAAVIEAELPLTALTLNAFLRALQGVPDIEAAQRLVALYTRDGAMLDTVQLASLAEVHRAGGDVARASELDLERDDATADRLVDALTRSAGREITDEECADWGRESRQVLNSFRRRREWDRLGPVIDAIGASQLRLDAPTAQSLLWTLGALAGHRPLSASAVSRCLDALPSPSFLLPPNLAQQLSESLSAADEELAVQLGERAIGDLVYGLREGRVPDQRSVGFALRAARQRGDENAICAIIDAFLDGEVVPNELTLGSLLASSAFLKDSARRSAVVEAARARGATFNELHESMAQVSIGRTGAPAPGPAPASRPLPDVDPASTPLPVITAAAQRLGALEMWDEVVALVSSVADAERLDERLVGASMKALAAGKRYEQVVEVFRFATATGVPANSYLVAGVVRALVALDHPAEALRTYSDAVEGGVDLGPPAYGWALNAALRVPDAESATAIIDRMLAKKISPSPTDWDVAMRACVEAWQPNLVCALFEQMPNGAKDDRNLQAALAGHLYAGQISRALEIFDGMQSFGVTRNSRHASTMIEGLLRSGWLEQAEELYEQVCEEGMEDPYLDALMVQVLARLGQPARAGDLARTIVERVTAGDEAESGLTARPVLRMVASIADAGLAEDSGLLIEGARSLDRDFDDDDIYKASISVSKLGRPDLVGQLWSLAEGAGSRDPRADVSALAASLRAGGSTDIGDVCRKIFERNDATYAVLSTTIAQLAQFGALNLALEGLQVMQRRGLRPDARLRGVVMDALTDAGRLEDVEAVHRSTLTDDDSPSETAYLFNLVVRAYARSGDIEAVESLKEEIISRGLPVDEFLLGANRSHLVESVLADGSGELMDELAEGWKDLSILLDDVLHELRQPAFRVGSSLRVVRQALERRDVETAAQSLPAVEENLIRVLERLREYEAFTLTSGEPVTIDMQGMVSAVVKSLARRAADAQVSFVERYAAENPWHRRLSVIGFPLLLRIALRALMGNAVDALEGSDVAPASRRVWVTVMFTPSLNSRGGRTGWIDTYVRDNGPGVPEEFRQSVFERGFSTKPGRGLGLGLSLVDRVADSLGGRVVLNESVRSGAEFLLRLPATPEGDE